jgi:Protein of unknown function (DUF3311)
VSNKYGHKTRLSSIRSRYLLESRSFALEVAVQRPALGSILLGLIPFAATCFSVSLWDRIHPMILGIPFNFFWSFLWLLITPICLWGALRIESRRELAAKRQQGGAD